LSALLRQYCPEFYDRSRTLLADLKAHDPRVIPAFENTAFATTTFNAGPLTRTIPHLDMMDAPDGQCAVSAFGNFDHRISGHMIIWDLKLILEFPPGYTILLPSGLFIHSNSALCGKDDKRYSITSYTGGALFRYRDHGFQYKNEASNKVIAEVAKGRPKSYADILQKYTSLPPNLS
jgi:hypothetical protein